MDILISLSRAFFVMTAAFFSQSIFKTRTKWYFLASTVFYALIDFAFYGNGYFEFIIKFITVFLCMKFLFKNAYFNSLIYSSLTMIFASLARIIYSMNLLFFDGLNRTDKIMSGFNEIKDIFGSLLICLILMFIYRNMFFNLKKNYSHINRDHIKLIIIDSMIILIAFFFLNRILIFAQKNIIEIRSIENLPAIIFGLVMLLLFMSYFFVYFLNANFLSKETLSMVKLESEIDQQTKAYNRRAGISHLEDCIKRNKYTGANLVISFIDINNLKKVNDRYGHEEGDKLIVKMAETINNTLRSVDFLVRFGGDEFLIIFQNCRMEDAENVWNRIQAEMENINISSNNSYRLSASAGFASMEESPTLTLKELIDLADTRMYKNKRMYKSGVLN